MNIGLIGIGKMGSGVAQRLVEAGHQVVLYDQSLENMQQVQGAKSCTSVTELVQALPTPRTVWLYLPAGDITNWYIGELASLLQSGDTVLDGGNSHFQSSIKRATELAAKGIYFLDVGTSSGILGRKNGYCLMIGGEKEVFDQLQPLWQAVAAPDGVLYTGPSGSGHYVKMVHNGIEYGLLQSYAEGVALLADSNQEWQLPLADIFKTWQHGSIVSSFLNALLAESLAADPTLQKWPNRIGESGEGRWTVELALERGIPLPVITAALTARYQSGKSENIANRAISALRHAFGGHQK